MEFGEDIFSLAFVSEIKDSILSKYFDAVAGKLREEEKEEKEEAPPILSINGTEGIVDTEPVEVLEVV